LRYSTPVNAGKISWSTSRNVLTNSVKPICHG
jgi:hypothetical protein